MKLTVVTSSTSVFPEIEKLRFEFHLMSALFMIRTNVNLFGNYNIKIYLHFLLVYYFNTSKSWNEDMVMMVFSVVFTA